MIFWVSTKRRQSVDKRRQHDDRERHGDHAHRRATTTRQKRPPIGRSTTSGRSEREHRGQRSVGALLFRERDRVSGRPQRTHTPLSLLPCHPAEVRHSRGGRLKRPRRSDSARRFACSLPGQIPVASAPTLSRPVQASCSALRPLPRRPRRSGRVARRGVPAVCLVNVAGCAAGVGSGSVDGGTVSTAIAAQEAGTPGATLPMFLLGKRDHRTSCVRCSVPRSDIGAGADDANPSPRAAAGRSPTSASPIAPCRAHPRA